MRISTALLTACLLALGAGCGPLPPSAKPAVDTAKIIDAIRSDEVKWNQDWAAKDTPRIVGHYAPDATVMNPGAPAAVGTAAIAAGVRQIAADPGFSLTFSSDKVDVAASGDLAASRGGYRMTSTDPKTTSVVTSTGAFVTVYKPRADGVWQAVWDIATPGPTTSVGAEMAGAPTAKAPQ